MDYGSSHSYSGVCMSSCISFSSHGILSIFRVGVRLRTAIGKVRKEAVAVVS